MPTTVSKSMLAVVAAVTGIGFSNAPASVVTDNPYTWTRTFLDDFNGSALDRTKWGYRNTGVRRDAVLTPDAVSIKDGVMKITTYTDGATNYTGMIGTQKLFEQKYGYFEAKIKFNSSPGTWSAFWLQSPTIGTPVGNVAAAGTEVDVVEHRAADASGNFIANRFNNALHWDGYGASHTSKLKLHPVMDGMDNDTWHVYGLSWSPTGYNFYFDDKLVWTFKDALSMRSEYLILSTEVEDQTWAGQIPTGGFGSYADSTTSIQVDYVRAFNSAGSITPTPEPTSLAVVGVVGGLLLKRRRS